MEEDPIIATSSSFPDVMLDVQDTLCHAPPPSCTFLPQILHTSMPLIHQRYFPTVSVYSAHIWYLSSTDTDKLARVSRHSSQSAHKKAGKGLLGIPWTCSRLSGDRWAVITCRYETIPPSSDFVLMPFMASGTFHVIWQGDGFLRRGE